MKFPVKGGVGEVYGSQVSSKKCYVKAITEGNKRKSGILKEKESCNRLRGIKECLSPKRQEGVEEGNSSICEEPRRLQMEPEEEILNVGLFSGKEGFATRIGGGMKPEVEGGIIECLRENADVFAFSPSDLKGIDPAIAVHILHEVLSVKPVKQKFRKFGAEKDEVIKREIEKLLEAKHITEVQFPVWLSNAVMVAKGGGKWCMCIDFRDLNRACPKDHYLLPQIDQLVDSTSETSP